MAETKAKSGQPMVDPYKMVGNWDTQSKALKEKYSQLTDADVKCETGKEEELIDRLRTRLNKGRDEVVNILRKGQPAKV
jgi:hypothetical protein